MGYTKARTVIIDPVSIHTHTLIMLHGRGSNAERFAYDVSEPYKPGLLCARTSSDNTIKDCLPGMRIVLPSAPLRRCTARKRIKMNIWFDSASFEDPDIREELQIGGLQENSSAIVSLIHEEAKLVGYSKIFLGGLSQGCALALYALLRLELEDKSLAGFIGLSSRMPFSNTIQQILSGKDSSSEEDDPFLSDDKNNVVESRCDSNEDKYVIAAAKFIKEEILDELFVQQYLIACQDTPVFFGHGIKDEVVPISLGRRCVAIMRTLGFQVSMKEYQELGHWFQVPIGLDDIIDFIKVNS